MDFFALVLNTHMNKKPLIYLHIGRHKTGTTFLQTFLRLNESLLLSKGILYPKTGIPKIIPFAHHNLAWEINRDERFMPVKGSQWENLHKEIENNNTNVVVLSSESFCEGFREEQIHSLKNKLLGYEVKIIVYLRRQDKWYQSAYKGLVWDGYTYNSFSKFVEYMESTGQGNYYNFIKRWEKYFEKESIFVRIYKEGQPPEHILKDFLSVIGLQYKTEDFVSIKNQNVSPNIKLIKIKCFVNRFNSFISNNRIKFYINVYENKLLYIFYKLINKIIPNFLIDNKLTTIQEDYKILKRYEESNSKIAKEYFQNAEKLF